MFRRLVHTSARQFVPATPAPTASFTSPKQVLTALGIDSDRVHPGVFGDNGWEAGSGPVFTCRNPATQETLAQVQSVRDRLLPGCFLSSDTCSRHRLKTGPS